MGSIDDVRERLPIEQIVGEVVALKRAGALYKGLCPFHGEKTPSFIVTPSRGRYHCFGCGADGDIFNFTMATRNLDFHTALHELAARANVELDDPRRQAEAGAVETRIYEMNAAAATFFQSLLASAPGTPARNYLRRRRITAATIDAFGLGYASDTRDTLCRRLRDAGYTNDEMAGGGLALAPEEGGPPRDRWHGRLMFPIRDAKGRIRGFGGRLLGDGEPKYLNSPATPVFDKSRVLYAIEHAANAIRGARESVVVEGYVDALRAHQEGFTNVVATLGTAITPSQLRALANLAPRLVLALDADPAGQKAAVRAGLAALSALPATDKTRHDAVRVFVAALPPGQDPDDAIAADPEGWRRAIAEATPLMDHYFALVESGVDRTRPEWRQEAIDTLAPVIGQLDGVGLQQTYIERLAGLTGVDARYLRDITPGGASLGAPRRRDTRRHAGSAPPAPISADPVRVTEEYLAGLLVLHRPLPTAARAELASYEPLTSDLAPLIAALVRGSEPQPAEEDMVERLATTAARWPTVAPDQLTGMIRVCLLRVSAERGRRALRAMGRVVAEVDRETAREMDSRALEVLTLKEQSATRLQQEQSRHYRHQPAGATGADDGA